MARAPAEHTAATVRQAVLLVDGLLARHALRPCGGRPFLAWQMRELARFGVTDVLLLTGPEPAAWEAALPGLAAALPRPMTVRCVPSPAASGADGALLRARPLLDQRFLLCRGTSLFDGNLADLLAEAADDPAPCRTVSTPAHGLAAPVDAGVRLLRQDLLAPGSPLQADAMPALAASGRPAATVVPGCRFDLEAPGGLARARAALPARLHRPALLLDRDGTINVDHGYVGTPERWEWMPGAAAAIAAATRAGWHVFVVTNQSGIARGLFDEAAVEALHAMMQDAVHRAGGTIDDIRTCPWHEHAVVERFRKASDWRKPGPGMILDLIARWELDPGRCVLVGDQPTDMQAAAAAGIASRLFEGGDLRHVVAPLLEAGRPWAEHSGARRQTRALSH